MILRIIFLLTLSIGCSNTQNILEPVNDSGFELKIMGKDCIIEESDMIELKVINQSKKIINLRPDAFYFEDILNSDKKVLRPKNIFNEIRKLDSNLISLAPNSSKKINLEINFLYHYKLSKNEKYFLSVKYDNEESKWKGNKVSKRMVRSDLLAFSLCD